MKNYFIVLIFLIVSMNSLHASDKLEDIIKNKKLKVCIWPEYYGITYLDIRTQLLEGIDADLAKELAKDLKVELEYIESSFPTLILDVMSNKCDIAMFAIKNTSKRKSKIRFTSPHLQSDIYAITSKTNKNIKKWEDIDKKGIVVAVAKGTYHVSVMQKKLKNAKLLIANSFQQRGKEVQSNRADVFMTDYPFAKKMLKKTNWAKIIKPDKTYYKSSYAWAMAYGNENFYQRVEQFIIDIKKDGRLLKLAKKNQLEPIIKLN